MIYFFKIVRNFKKGIRSMKNIFVNMCMRALMKNLRNCFSRGQRLDIDVGRRKRVSSGLNGIFTMEAPTLTAPPPFFHGG